MKNKSTSLQKQEVQHPEVVERTRSTRVFSPAVDIWENDDNILLLADLPGVAEEDIDIRLEHDVLTIQGKVNSTQPEGFELSYGEYETGDYQRSFTLTDSIDREKIEASYKNGVLKLVLPKTEPAKPKKIQVNVK